MNTIDTIYFTGDLLVGKVSGYNDVLPIVIKQTTEPCCENTKEIVGMLCNAIVPIVLIVVVGWLIWKIVSQCQKNKNAVNERMFKERESLIKLKQEYESKILGEFSSYKKVVDFIQEEKKKQSSSVILTRIEGLLAEDENKKYAGKLQKYMNELNARISELNKKLGIKTDED